MRLLPLVLFVALIALTGAIETSWEGRIAGGVAAALGQFPNQGWVSDYENTFICGGWIYNTRWVGTSAFWTRSRTIEDTKVFLGTISLVEGGVEYLLSNIVVHPEFDLETFDNNLSLLQIDGIIDFNTNLRAIPLSTDFISAGIIATTAGFGGTMDNHETPSPFMKFVSLPTISNENCLSRQTEEHRNKVSERVLCLDTQEGIGSCYGDGGNVLIANGVVIGSMSFSTNCTIGSHPETFLRTSFYLPWIISVAG